MNVGNKPIGKTWANTAKNTVQTGYKTTKNTITTGYTQFQKTGTITKVLSIIFVIIFILVLIFWAMYAYNVSKTREKMSPFLITSPVNAFDNQLAKRNFKVPEASEGLAFSYSFWIYIANWNYRFGKWKNILLKGNDERRAPGIWLYPKTNSLHARINTYADPNEGCDIKNIPLQKWVHIVFVLNNRNIDIYIDGKLERSCVLRGVPIFNNDNVRIAQDGGFYGQIAKVQYFNRAVEPLEVSEIYSEGPLAPSKFGVSFFRDGKFLQFKKHDELDLRAEDEEDWRW